MDTYFLLCCGTWKEAHHSIRVQVSMLITLQTNLVSMGVFEKETRAIKVGQISFEIIAVVYLA